MPQIRERIAEEEVENNTPPCTVSDKMDLLPCLLFQERSKTFRTGVNTARSNGQIRREHLKPMRQEEASQVPHVPCFPQESMDENNHLSGHVCA